VAADAEHLLIGIEEIELSGRLVDSVTGETGHRVAGAWVPGLLTKGMADTVLMSVTTAAEFDRVVGEEQRLVAAVGLVTGRALEILVGQMSSFLPGLRTAWIVTPGAQGLRFFPQ
jgi:hypothetical protein